MRKIVQMRRRGGGSCTSWTWELWERKRLDWVFSPGLLPGGGVQRDKCRGAAQTGFSCPATCWGCEGDPCRLPVLSWPQPPHSRPRRHVIGLGKPSRHSSPRPLVAGPAGRVPGLKAHGSATETAVLDMVPPQQRVGRGRSQCPGL